MPLKYGFASMFHGRISDRGATALALPATYGTAFGFMFSYSRVLQAMSRSGEQEEPAEAASTSAKTIILLHIRLSSFSSLGM